MRLLNAFISACHRPCAALAVPTAALAVGVSVRVPGTYTASPAGRAGGTAGGRAAGGSAGGGTTGGASGCACGGASGWTTGGASGGPDLAGGASHLSRSLRYACVALSGSGSTGGLDPGATHFRDPHGFRPASCQARADCSLRPGTSHLPRSSFGITPIFRPPCQARRGCALRHPAPANCRVLLQDPLITRSPPEAGGVCGKASGDGMAGAPGDARSPAPLAVNCQ